MSAVLDGIRDGSWLTAERLRNYPLMLLSFTVVACIGLVATADGHGVDAWGRPLGTDFSNVWTAGVMALEGRAAEAYDTAQQHALQQQVFDRPDIPFYGWLYPPTFLYLAIPLARLPYLAALALWMALTLCAYAAVVHRLIPERAAWPAILGFPAVFVTLTHGQNAFFTTALCGGFFLCLDRRPILAGLLLGVLSYKPQLGLLFPVALLFGGHGRAFVAAAVTTLALVGSTVAGWGLSLWSAYRAATDFAREVLQGGIGFEKVQSVFAGAHILGAPMPVAYAVQAASALGALSVVAWLWSRRTLDREVQASALVAGLLLSTPYFMDYDLVLLAIPIASMTALGLRSGFRPWEKTLLAAMWVLPLVCRTLAGLGLPTVPLVLWLLLGLLVARARSARLE